MGSHDDNPASSVVCIHRGKLVGVASCGCGSVFQCNLLGKWCGSKEPIDNFVSLLKRELTKETYQCCAGCEQYERGKDDRQTAEESG